MKLEQQQKLYDTLKAIAREFQTPPQLRKSAEKQYGLDYEEALEMAYENIQNIAQGAIKGVKRPTESPDHA